MTNLESIPLNDPASTGTDCFLWVVLRADCNAIHAAIGRGQH